jgi:phosphoglycolate phosphatase-like HAD superfamily hydrolase
VTGLAGLPRRPDALLLDFDGVILASAEIKARAFAEVYAGAEPAALAAVMAYQRLHGGVSRREKFAHFETAIFGRPATPERIEDLSRRFAEIVFERVLDAPFVPGAEAFLQATRRESRLFLVSGTPQGELVEVLAARGLSNFFEGVVGAPTRKMVAFSRILREIGLPPARALAIGDASTELLAARSLGVPFLWVAYEAARPPWVDAPVTATLEGVAAALGFGQEAEAEGPR